MASQSYRERMKAQRAEARAKPEAEKAEWHRRIDRKKRSVFAAMQRLDFVLVSDALAQFPQTTSTVVKRLINTDIEKG